MVITTHATLAGEVMQASLARLAGPSLLIADEAHHLGAKEGRSSLPPQFGYRMASPPHRSVGLTRRVPELYASTSAILSSSSR